jgi:hypothetical protein
VFNEAFRDHWGSTETNAEQRAYHTGQKAFRPALSFLAYADDEPLGVIIGYEFDAATEATGIRELHIPLIGTRRAGRKRHSLSAAAEGTRRGQGRRTHHRLAGSRRRFTHRCARGLYERAGFTVTGTWIAQQKPVLTAEPAEPR